MSETIVAIATPSGQGGVAIVRLSGENALEIAGKIAKNPTDTPRMAKFTAFVDQKGELFDQGLMLYFKAPFSFTGEEVVELHCHGGRAVTQLLLEACLAAGARMALPGEFSQRAFLNDKMDLAQAEAVADLIDAQSTAAVKAASRSLQGAFSQVIQELVADLVQLRVYIEAALDFPEEEIDFLAEGDISSRLQLWGERLQRLIEQSGQGRLINDGINLVLIGKPNAGKSSLLNALLGDERAIVTEQAGTTRDVIKESIVIEGMPVNILDTAGLRDSDDLVEQEGIRRTQQAIKQADIIVLLIDGAKFSLDYAQEMAEIEALKQTFPAEIPVMTVYNKADLVSLDFKKQFAQQLWIAAKNGEQIDAFKCNVADKVGRQVREETPFIARERHMNALKKAQLHYQQAVEQLVGYRVGELVAEDLRLVHEALGEITGKMKADDLLGEIFSSFCIGK
ncbi:tRNA uridine-5-carboxymethylaminomethyl(34) synthesis GTPase MnmE [Rappaport israeli]|uniref:tRNA uridine-5-carboxymethylaminomethyl(34) synthesis GTPase MnmE n=1 Tax=Rappaport israeli TaxID=1839807 RepID=UPI000931CCF4|nr:tRNA uridine-5-carboxymethylaminomethyl(34) synthesis GTPase MnmE [Rappaport israeli]